MWSLQPIQSPQPPQVPENTWSEQPIDRFVLDRLRSADLQPSPPADRRTLIRRVTFALTGLPPTAEEVDAFIADTSDKAYEKVVDRLLSSPHYGEHWARHWLDVARYSDTKGYVYAREEKRWVHASAYRDWVAQAFNDDMPYDRFVRLQIAADQIEPARSPHLVAMGYLTLGRRFLGVTHDIIDDRIDVVTRGMLGMTVACARCHDHKYDPISTRDYYSLYGVFQSCSEELVPCDANSAEAASNTNIDPAALEELTKRQTKLREMMSLRREEQAARSRSRLDRYLLAQLELDQYPEEVFNQLLDESDLNPVVVRRWQDFLSRDAQSSQPVFAAWHERATAKDVEGMRQLAAEYGKKAAAVEAAWRELLKTNPASTELPNTTDEGLRRVLYGVDSPCHVPDEHITNIEMYFPTNVIVELWKYQGEVDRWLIENPKTPAHATVLVDRPKAVTPRVFLRGNPLNKGAEVPRHFLTALRSMNAGQLQLFQHGSGRRELAEAITDPRNPLTARYRQSCLDASFGTRNRQHAKRFWVEGGTAHAPRAARLACVSIDRFGLEAEGFAANYFAVEDISARFSRSARCELCGASAAGGSRQSIVVARWNASTEFRRGARRMVGCIQRVESRGGRSAASVVCEGEHSPNVVRLHRSRRSIASVACVRFC